MAQCCAELGAGAGSLSGRGRGAEKGVIVMASASNLEIRGSSHVIHLRLRGCFDNHLACELVDVLKASMPNAYRVVIYTGELDIIDPLACVKLRDDFSDLRPHRSRIVFTGANAEQIAPQGSLLFL